MVAVSPVNDRVDIYSAALTAHAETSPFSLVQSVLSAGSNVTFTPNIATGKIVVAAGGAAATSVAHDATLTGDGSAGAPLSVAQATETQLGGGQIITQAEANSGANDTDVLTITKLLGLGGVGLTTLRTLIGAASGPPIVGHIIKAERSPVYAENTTITNARIAERDDKLMSFGMTSIVSNDPLFGPYNRLDVTFNTPLPDTNYLVMWSLHTHESQTLTSDTVFFPATATLKSTAISLKTVNGFSITTPSSSTTDFTLLKEVVVYKL